MNAWNYHLSGHPCLFPFEHLPAAHTKDPRSFTWNHSTSKNVCKWALPSRLSTRLSTTTTNPALFLWQQPRGASAYLAQLQRASPVCGGREGGGKEGERRSVPSRGPGGRHRGWPPACPQPHRPAASSCSSASGSSFLLCGHTAVTGG